MFDCEPDCPRCAGHACNACVADDPALPIGSACSHDTTERHRGMPAIDLARKVTKELPPLVHAAAITVDLGPEASDKIADWFEAAAKIARTHGGVKLTAEPPPRDDRDGPRELELDRKKL